MNSVRALWRKTTVKWLVMAHLVLVAVLGLRGIGMLEWIELTAYDLMIRLTAGSNPGPERVVLVGATEDDLNRWGWPLSDTVLSDAIERLAAMAPRAIGVDLYRDLPRQPGGEKLDATLQRHKNTFVVFKFAEGENSGIPPPAVLRGTDRVGFADTVADPGGIMRRGLLFLDDGKSAVSSLPLVLALEYLKPHNIGLAPDERNPEHLRLGPVTLRPFGAHDGGYVGADDRGYQSLLDYLGGARPFQRLTLSALLDGQVQPDTVRDKVVLIGVAAESVKDFFFTPFSYGLGHDQSIFGIELHGHFTAQLLRHALDKVAAIETPGQTAETLWIWLWCLIGGLMGVWLRSPLYFAAAALAGVAVLALIAYLAFLLAWWIPLLPPVLGAVVTAGLVTSLMSKEEKVQRDMLMQIFERNVSPEIADALWRERDTFLEGGRPRPQKLTATVLFTDLRGFTTISESLEPQQLMEWLNHYMDTMATVVIERGGVIDKYIGDAIMAVFGIPFARASREQIAADAIAAVDCALAMSDTLARLNTDWKAQGQPTIGMRVGVFTGPLVAGNLGSTQRMNYTVLGDTVNTAARLESYDKTVGDDRHCRILIGSPTLELVGDRYEVTRIGDVSLKGKAEKTNVFMVLGRNPKAL